LPPWHRLDDGWAGLSDSARQRLASADVVIGAGRTLALVGSHLAPTAELIDMDGKLGQVPGWMLAARDAGKTVVALATGDPLCHGIASWLTGKLGRDGFEILPAVSTLQLAFARFKTPWQDIKISTCHTADAGEWFVGATPAHGLYKLMRAIALNPRVALFTGPDNNPARLARALITAGYGDEVKLSIACRLLLPDEAVFTGLAAVDVENRLFPEPNVVLVESTETAPMPVFGLEDLEYIQRSPEKGLITKQEARALSLAKLRLKPDAIVWDIGAGSGSVGLECRPPGPHGHVWAIEKNEGDAANARANAAPFPHRQLHAVRRQGAGPTRHLARPGRRFHRRFGRRTGRIDPLDPRPSETGWPAGDEFRHPRKPGRRNCRPQRGRRGLGCRPAPGQPQPTHSRHAPTGRPEPGVDCDRKQGKRSMNQTSKPYGKLIGASLGPGDPELITRRSWAVLQSGARWLYPVKKAEESSYALSIVERGGLPIPADAEQLVFPMTRDADILAKAWTRAAARTVELLAEGRDLVFLVEGDASTFATFGHLARVVRELVPNIEVETIPGVSSFAAAAASTGITLAEEDETLAVIPANYGVGVIDHLLDEFDTLVLFKVKPQVDEVIELLARRDLLATSVFIEKVGAPDERIVRDVSSLKGEKVNYLSLILVQNPKRVRGELRRGCRKRKEAETEESAKSKAVVPA
jgi:precorrin-6Y C5,15-methyltransferase (decarboxylating)